MQARAGLLGGLVARQPGVAALLPAAFVAEAFQTASANSQRAWSLLFYALWHSHHVLGLDAQGDIGAVLDAAGGIGG